MKNFYNLNRYKKKEIRTINNNLALIFENKN